MATLSTTKTYSDNSLLSASDLDAIIDSIETFVNTTGLNDDNLNASAITANSKIKTSSITTAKIADSAVTADKIIDNSITTAKILDNAVTAAKIAEDTLTSSSFYSLAPLASEGVTILFHTFNGTLSIPRGWMKCNGDQILESTYDAIHGAGAYETDGISSSNLLTKYLPDMVNKYPIGTANTTQTGTTAITSEGNPNNQADFSHTHTLPDHDHDFELEQNGDGSGTGIEGNRTVFDTSTPTTDNKSVSTELSSTQSIQPESIEFIYLMKVI